MTYEIKKKNLRSKTTLTWITRQNDVVLKLGQKYMMYM